MLEIYNEEYKDLLARGKGAAGKTHKARLGGGAAAPRRGGWSGTGGACSHVPGAHCPRGAGCTGCREVRPAWQGSPRLKCPSCVGRRRPQVSHDANGATTVTDLTLVDVNTPEAVRGAAAPCSAPRAEAASGPGGGTARGGATLRATPHVPGPHRRRQRAPPSAPSNPLSPSPAPPRSRRFWSARWRSAASAAPR